MTLAPISASCRTHVGPDRARVRSITVYGSSGKVMSASVSLVGPMLPPLARNHPWRGGGTAQGSVFPRDGAGAAFAVSEAGVWIVDDLRREFWLHKPSAHLWAVELSGRDESLLACCGPFTARTARVVALDELAYGRGPTLDWLRERREEFERYDALADAVGGGRVEAPRAGAASAEVGGALPRGARRPPA